MSLFVEKIMLMKISIMNINSSAYRMIKIILLLSIMLLASPLSFSEDVKTGNNTLQKGNYSAEFQKFKTLAEQGDPEAQVYLGAVYYHGKGVTQDYQRALKWPCSAALEYHLYAC